jgi:hypothetical protein
MSRGRFFAGFPPAFHHFPVFLAAGSNILADSVFLLPPKGKVSPQADKNRL